MTIAPTIEMTPLKNPVTCSDTSPLSTAVSLVIRLIVSPVR